MWVFDWHLRKVAEPIRIDARDKIDLFLETVAVRTSDHEFLATNAVNALLAQMTAEKFLLFTLVLARVSGLTITAPIYGGRDIPAVARALLCFALALLITPMQWHASVVMPSGMLDYLASAAGELAIGVCLGLGVMILFYGMQLAGELVAQVGGLMLADVYDPGADTSVPLFSKFFFLVAAAVFVCIGGHRMVLGGLLDTFAAVGPGGNGLPTDVADAFVLLLTESFALGLRAAAPVVAALLTATLVMGLIGRTLPQLNVMVMGFGINAMLTFAVLGLSLGAAVRLLPDYFPAGVEAMLTALGAGPETLVPMTRDW